MKIGLSHKPNFAPGAEYEYSNTNIVLLPDFSSFMVYDDKTHDTIVIGATLSASPVTGENAAVELGKVVLGTLYGNSIVPKGDAAAPPKDGDGK